MWSVNYHKGNAFIRGCNNGSTDLNVEAEIWPCGALCITEPVGED